MKSDRLNTKLDAAVNRGLAAALLGNIPAAFKIMGAEGVPPHVMSRVIFDPQQRRATDWKR